MSGYRPQYTRQEEVEILRYIIENRAFFRLRGQTIWKEMQKAGVGNNRTHHSLKEHFRKFMASRLSVDFYGVIDEKDLNKIKEGYCITAVGFKTPGPDLSKTPPASNADVE